jgi:uncharacterized protein
LNDTAVRPKRRLLRWLALLFVIAIALLAKGYWNATRDPIIRTASLTVDEWTPSQPPVKILLLSDTHVAGPDMPPERLERLVRRFNALKPDLVLIAGDLVSEKRLATHLYTASEVVAPLGKLEAPLGVIVAPGNHDHWFDPKALRTELEAVGLTVLQNSAVMRGPLVIGGIDDDFTGHDDIPATYAAMAKLPQAPRILVSHSPDVVPDLPAPVYAVFAGHTHCGQIVLPLVGAISYVSRYGDRFACGAINDNGQRVFVGAGLGTSILPLRYGAVPDAWLVTLGPKIAQ